jgi:hypothetical protein
MAILPESSWADLRMNMTPGVALGARGCGNPNLAPHAPARPELVNPAPRIWPAVLKHGLGRPWPNKIWG